MGVEGGPREAHPFGRLVIINEPLNLLDEQKKKNDFNFSVNQPG
jgi:hypothetical protein